MNQSSFVGRLGSTPEIKATQNGVARAKVSLAVDSSRLVDGNWEDDVTWVPLIFWGKQAEYAAENYLKGDTLVIESAEYREYKIEDRYFHEFSVRKARRIMKGRLHDSAEGEEEEYSYSEEENVPF
jgi:single stranded DNA-binding protein